MISTTKKAENKKLLWVESCADSWKVNICSFLSGEPLLHYNKLFIDKILLITALLLPANLGGNKVCTLKYTNINLINVHNRGVYCWLFLQLLLLVVVSCGDPLSCLNRGVFLFFFSIKWREDSPKILSMSV